MLTKLQTWVGKARKYLGIALGFLKKLVGFGEKADKALDQVEDQLQDEKEAE